jgi:hypothetical protein
MGGLKPTFGQGSDRSLPRSHIMVSGRLDENSSNFGTYHTVPSLCCCLKIDALIRLPDSRTGLAADPFEYIYTVRAIRWLVHIHASHEVHTACKRGNLTQRAKEHCPRMGIVHRHRPVTRLASTWAQSWLPYYAS